MRLENSFIPVRGVGEETERRLWRNGVTCWDEFDGAHVGSRLARRIEAFIGEARGALDDGDARFFADALPSGEAWRLYEDFRGDARFFDIETTGLSRDADVTVVSVHGGGETETFVRGRDLTPGALAEAFEGAPLVVSFNGKRFDAPFLERFGVPLPGAHLDLMYPCRRLDLTGGLKRIEGEVGIERDRPDLSGEDAVRLWRRHERGDGGALGTLVSYNREDAEHLRALADHVAARLHEAVFEPALPGAPGGV